MTWAKNDKFKAPCSRRQGELFVLFPGKNNIFFTYPKIEAPFTRQRGKALFAFCFQSPRAKNPTRPRQKNESFALPQCQGTLQPTSEGRRLVSFHLLRAPYDLGKRRLFTAPNSRHPAADVRGALFALSFYALRAPCDLSKKNVFFLTPNLKHPAADVRGGRADFVQPWSGNCPLSQC